tara:strand:+ start:162 stop:482 length:321 start_codon:yes stop_codon:yes gene_type:complete
MKFDHIAIRVRNIFASIDWYKEHFNAIVDYNGDSWAMLKIGDMSLALIAEDIHPPHFSLEIDSFNDFPAGTEINTHRDGSYYLYKSDPDGNVAELIYWPAEKENGS